MVRGGRREASRAFAIVARVPAEVGGQSPRKNSNSHIDASHSRQPLVKGERLVRYEVNAVMLGKGYALRQRRNKAPLRDYWGVETLVPLD